MVWDGWRIRPVADYEIPEELMYTKDDEWIRREDDQVVIGVSDFAQNQLGDIVFVELPEVGATTESGKTFGTIESVKAVSDLYAPLSADSSVHLGWSGEYVRLVGAAAILQHQLAAIVVED